MSSVSNRRGFLRQSGKVLGGAALAGVVGAASLGNAKEVETKKAVAEGNAYKYVPLDMEKVRKRAHRLHHVKSCCAGSFEAIVGALAEEVGAPFDMIPVDMMKYGGSGVAGFGTLCGALNGSSAAISLVCNESDTKALVTELLSWYAATPLPTDVSNGYAEKHAFEEADNYTIDTPLKKSVAGGNLCHMSVSNWCKGSNFASGSKERSERCARLTGDVAAKAVELLNAHAAGTFAAAEALPASSSSCRDCHQKSEHSHTRGKMDCQVCHVTPTTMPRDDVHEKALLPDIASLL